METYNPKAIEAKWREIWEKSNFFKIDKDDNSKEKFYVLDMFPYPSGTGLHMGHVESYASSDVFYRFKKMQGYNVLHPQGFDSFGLPTENYAIKTGVKPSDITQQNIATYIKQMKSLGFDYDFDEKVITSDPGYYKWTQWIFGKFFENGWVYKKTQKANWCSSCQTVIANEQVLDGKCERCGTEILQKEVPGWFFKITDFADDLITDLEKVDWPEHTKKNQINWIGKSEGTSVNFQIANNKKFIEVFTTRVDTIFGCTYCVVAPEHKIIPELKDKIENWDAVEKYIEESQKKTDLDRMEAKEKTGVELKGVKVINPFNSEEVPVYVADYVLGGYGTGAVMAVPAHDERDFEFAKKYDLSIRQSIAPIFVVKDGKDAVRADKETITRKTVVAIIKHWEKDEIFCLNWEKFGWKSFVIGGVEENESGEEAAIREIKEESGYQNIKNIQKIGGEVHSNFYAEHKGENRYAKTECYYVELGDGTFVEPKKEDITNHTGEWVSLNSINKYINLNVHEWFCKIFENKENAFTEDGVLINSDEFSSLNSEQAREKMTAWLEEKDLGKKVINYRLRDWSFSRQRYWGCPIPIVYSPDGEAHLIPEEHLPWTLPEDVDFVPTGVAPLAKSEELKQRVEKIFGAGWTAEYDTMDTFVDSSWYFLRYPDPQNDENFCSDARLQKWLPVDLYIGGAEHTYMHLLFARFFTKAMHEIGLIDFDEPFLKLRHQGMVLDKFGKKMSKSKGNVVNPDSMVEKFGADSVRAYMLFASPLEDEVIWNEENVIGIYRFLEKVWKLSAKVVNAADANKKLQTLLHQTIKKVTEDMENLKYNTNISALMILVNAMERETGISVASYELLVTMLAPFAPYIAEELWEKLGHTESIFLSKWPEYNSELIKDEEVNLVIQINGKVRDMVMVSADISEEEAKEIALASEKIKTHLVDKEIKKIIFVPGKLLSIVV